DVVNEALDWAGRRIGPAPLLVYSSAPPDRVRAVQQQLGVGAAGSVVGGALARIARGVVQRGGRQLLVAGGGGAGASRRAAGAGRRWASRRCESACRSPRACPGATRTRRPARPVCTSR